MITNVPSPTFVATVPAPMWREDSNATARMDLLLDLCKYARTLMSVKKWVTNAPSVATTYRDLSVASVHTVTLWPQMADIVRTWMNALLRPTTANSPARILSVHSCASVRKATLKWA